MKYFKEFWVALNYIGLLASLLCAAYLLHHHNELLAVYNIVIAFMCRLNLLEVDLKQAGPEMTEEQFNKIVKMLLGKPSL